MGPPYGKLDPYYRVPGITFDFSFFLTLKIPKVWKFQAVIPKGRLGSNQNTHMFQTPLDRPDPSISKSPKLKPKIASS